MNDKSPLPEPRAAAAKIDEVRRQVLSPAESLGLAGATLEEVATVLYYKVLQWAGYSRNLKVAAFERRLKSHGVEAVLRRSRGLDISAACGQLRVEVEGRRKVAAQQDRDVEQPG